MTIREQTAVVLDANLYRSMTHGESVTHAMRMGRSLADADRRSGFTPVASPSVVVELVTQRAQRDTDTVAGALSALCMLGIHCNEDPAGRGRVRIMRRPDDILTEVLFGTARTAAGALADATDTLLSTVLSDPRPEVFVHTDAHRAALAAYVHQVEAGFTHMRGWLARRLAIDATDARQNQKRRLASEYSRYEAADYLVQRACVAAQQDPGMEPVGSLKRVRHTFATAIEFAVQRMGRVPDGGRHAKDDLWAWAWELSFLAGQSFTSAVGSPALPVRVVTEVRALQRAARAIQPYRWIVLPQVLYLSRNGWSRR